MRLKIRRYLEYVLNKKVNEKVKEEEVFEILNKNLEIKMRSLINARILQNIKVLKHFEKNFLAEATKKF